MRIESVQRRRRAGSVGFIWIALALTASHPIIARSTETSTAIPPVSPACVSSPFGPRILQGRPLAGTFHSGIDLPARVGAPVLAVAAGTVIRAQKRGVGGLEILVQHAGFIGVYSHLGLIAPRIAEGHRTVYAGQRLATVGRSGLTYGSHLYFGMIVDGRSVDPVAYLGVRSCQGSATP